MKAGKIWGETQVLLSTPAIEVHQLRIIPNAWCSLHRHQSRWNAFYVTAGQLLVHVRAKGYDLDDTTVLRAGEFTTVPPGLWHKFETQGEGAECIEVYYPAAMGIEDIERQGAGGRQIP